MTTPSPEYICWHENEFMADRAVVRMQPHQRLMYRALCQVARYCETRPYLPDDDNELFILADADSLDHWKANREAVLVKFQKVTVDGKSMLAQKRVLTDAARYEEWLAQKRGAGRASAESRRQQALNGRSTDAQQSSESNESCEKVKSNAVLQNGEPVPTTSGFDHNFKTPEPQNDKPSEQTPLPTEREIVEMIAPPHLLCDLFEKHILASNAGRKARGKKMADPRPGNWEHTWKSDFKRLIDSGYSFSDLEKMINYSFGPRWVDFTFRPFNVVKNHDKLAADLKLSVRELIPEPSHQDKMRAKAMRAAEKDKEELDDALAMHVCASGCGSTVEHKSDSCLDCKMKWSGAYKANTVRGLEVHFKCDDSIGGCGEKQSLKTPGQLCPTCQRKRKALSSAEFANMTGGKRVQ